VPASGVEPTRIRPAKKEDVDAIADLIVRTKRLNNEFDPLFGVAQGVQDKARAYLLDSLTKSGVVLLVATIGTKVVGAIRGEIRHRVFYEPDSVGHITDFYIFPEFRRRALGNEVIGKMSAELSKMGAEMITCEVPTRNEIAVSFYQKNGFRSLLQTFAKHD
jgi:ribosomal protein S18 acetylase RimI-like enzyme